MSSNRRVLVTGAGGFIGRASLEPLLAAGYEVHAVLSPQSVRAPAFAARLPSVVERRADLLDLAAIETLVDAVRPSHLLHFAWIATPGLYWQSADNARWLAASKALLRAFHSRGGRRAVVAGSCAEYHWSEAGGICHETGSPLAAGTTTPYAASKLELKRWLDEFAGAQGLSSAWGRVFFQYGPGEPRQRLVASVIVALLGGHEAPCTHGRQIRSFLHVADVGAAFGALLESNVRGAVNVGSGERISIAELLRRLARQIGRPDLLKLGARPAPPGEPAVLLPDIGRLRDEVSFRPKWTLDAGLADAVRWWRETLADDAPATGSS